MKKFGTMLICVELENNEVYCPQIDTDFSNWCIPFGLGIIEFLIFVLQKFKGFYSIYVIRVLIYLK